MQKNFLLVIVAALCFAGAGAAWAHGGGLDGYGCHHNRKVGGYHCHRGPLAGQHFESKNEMLKRLEAGEKSKPKNTPKQEK